MLLVFFLVTTTIDMDKGLGMVLPAKGEETQVKKNITNVSVNASGKVAIGNREDFQIVDVRELKQIATSKLAENDKMIFSVKTDNRTKYQVYIDVIDQLKRSGATRISIAEPEE